VLLAQAAFNVIAAVYNNAKAEYARGSITGLLAPVTTSVLTTTATKVFAKLRPLVTIQQHLVESLPVELFL